MSDLALVLVAYQEARARHGAALEEKHRAEVAENAAYQAYHAARVALKKAVGVSGEEDAALVRLAELMQGEG